MCVPSVYFKYKIPLAGGCTIDEVVRCLPADWRVRALSIYTHMREELDEIACACGRQRRRARGTCTPPRDIHPRFVSPSTAVLLLRSPPYRIAALLAPPHRGKIITNVPQKLTLIPYWPNPMTLTTATPVKSRYFAS